MPDGLYDERLRPAALAVGQPVELPGYFLDRKLCQKVDDPGAADAELHEAAGGLDRPRVAQAASFPMKSSRRADTSSSSERKA